MEDSRKRFRCGDYPFAKHFVDHPIQRDAQCMVRLAHDSTSAQRRWTINRARSRRMRRRANTDRAMRTLDGLRTRSFLQADHVRSSFREYSFSPVDPRRTRFQSGRPRHVLRATMRQTGTQKLTSRGETGRPSSERRITTPRSSFESLKRADLAGAMRRFDASGRHVLLGALPALRTPRSCLRLSPCVTPRHMGSSEGGETLDAPLRS